MSGAQNRLQERFVHVEGMHVRVVESGSGRPLFLIHGLGGPQMWEKIIATLAEKFRLIVPDLPGFGESSPPPAPFGTEDYLRFIDKLMDAMAIPHAAFAGISYGGEICALWSSRAPQRVDRLVLIAPTGFNRPFWPALNDVRWAVVSFAAKHILLRSTTFLSLNGARSFRDVRKRPAGFAEKFRRQLLPAGKREVFLQTVRNISSPRIGFREELQRITSPTMIVWGADDRVVSPADAMEYKNTIPHASMITINECGHSVPLEQPAELADAIMRFTGDAQ